MSVAKVQYKNFVGGEWVESVSGGTMDVLNPSTGETIAEVPRGSAEDVERAVAQRGRRCRTGSRRRRRTGWSSCSRWPT